MHHIMFDIDGTLVESYELDSICFVSAVEEVTGICIDSDWSKYQHVTDSGILNEIIKSNNILNEKRVHADVKQAFVKRLKQAIELKPIYQVPGASSFLSLLSSMNNVKVSFATGGWYESALLKLRSAGIDFSKIPIASANNSQSRIEIMRIASIKANIEKNAPCTYFGDGSWDKKACQQLGFKFILIGKKIDHAPNFIDFKLTDELLKCICL